MDAEHGGMLSPSMMDQSRAMKSKPQPSTVGSYVKDSAIKLSRAPSCCHESVLFKSLISPVCVDAACYRSIQLRRGGCYPRPQAATTTETPWAYNAVHPCSITTIFEGVWRNTSRGCTMDPIQVCICAQVLQSPKRCVGGHTSIWLYNESLSRLALLEPKGELLTSKIRPVKVPRLSTTVSS